MSGPHEERPTHRFSNRVADYVRYRPGYPPELIAWLRDAIGLEPSWEIADVGCGTGMLAAPFLANGNFVYGIEPNDAMRAAAETAFGADASFVSIAGTAEATSLPRASVDLVTAGQAFHWFDPVATRAEWLRILRPGGWALVVFNSRRVEATPFMAAYERLLGVHAIGYEGVDHRRVLGQSLREFLGPVVEWRFRFTLARDLDAVRGLALSSSYVPAAGHPKHAPFMEALETLFHAHAVEGRVAFPYETEAYAGRLA
jgi:SAM-dependent methyltransferase